MSIAKGEARDIEMGQMEEVSSMLEHHLEIKSILLSHPKKWMLISLQA